MPQCPCAYSQAQLAPRKGVDVVGERVDPHADGCELVVAGVNYRLRGVLRRLGCFIARGYAAQGHCDAQKTATDVAWMREGGGGGGIDCGGGGGGEGVVGSHQARAILVGEQCPPSLSILNSEL